MRFKMKAAKLFHALFVASLLPLSSIAQIHQAPPQSRAELSHYQETSRYEEVLHFFEGLQTQTPFLKLQSFGTSGEGRSLPLVILSDPPISQPSESRASGKPIIFILANIHAGEVEGKEAMQHLARRLATGDLRPLLGKLVILIAPIYNADGNERISLKNRTDQNGPIGGVGVRENSNGLDLNRDYVKLEAPETQALIHLFNNWDPHLVIDLHTTDGSYHGYHLTYSPMLNPDSDPRLIDYERDKMLPAISKAMLSRHHYRTYYYGNFAKGSANGRELLRFQDASTNANEKMEPTVWRTFDYHPMFGNNYVGLRNRFPILSEAYSHLDFRGRVEVTTAFVEEILKYTSAHAKQVCELTRLADADAIHQSLNGNSPAIGVAFEPKPLPQPVDFLVGEVIKVKNPRSDTDMIAMVEDRVTPVKLVDYGLFAPTRTVPKARAYLFPTEPGMNVPMAKLQAHGITVEELTAPLTTEVESFVIGNVEKAPRQFQGHNQVKLTGEYSKELVVFPVGTILVRTAQPLGTLAAYLLEPETSEGLVTWNFLDDYLTPGKTYPIHRLMNEAAVHARILSPLRP
ncbi:MAG: peptidase carboxypeptidase [Pedosphaera sp.]|nr:peptidase carboxypeptidase [Pedosphaera sp.]